MAKRKQLTAPAWQAHHRLFVKLPDGRIGRLQYVTRQSKVATVVVAGRRIRLPFADCVRIKVGDIEAFGSVATQ